ncbi:MAG: hypothetical protein ACJA0J_001389, partial [Bdellovibrionota bacterium]
MSASVLRTGKARKPKFSTLNLNYTSGREIKSDLPSMLSQGSIFGKAVKEPVES